MRPQAWFEMQDIRKRRIADAVWIPLRASKMITTGRFGTVGFEREFFGAGSVAVPVANRAAAAALGWSEIGLSHLQHVVASATGYKPIDVYRGSSGLDVGVELVFEQGFDGAEPSVWHLHQDLVSALGLLREGDTWVCPAEGYIDVCKLTRHDGAPVELSIRAEHLRDYLAARGMVLRIASYRSHEAVMPDASHISWPDDGIREHATDERFETRKHEIHEGGTPVGTRTAVFHVARTDVDPELDVPLLGPETATNTSARSWSIESRGERLWHVIGEHWRNEWVEASAASTRVRGDKVASTAYFFTDAAGTRESADALRDEDIGKWLWFKPDIVNAILARRGGRLCWCTRDTGELYALPWCGVHFGVNGRDLITAYAYDVARLPEWLKQVWAGFNVSPDGKVSHELLEAQVRAEPASTRAPEARLSASLDDLEAAFAARWNAAIFAEHASRPAVIRSIHRFRANSLEGLLALAKDVARVTADSFNVGELQAIAPLRAGEKKRGSLKSLEAALATLVPAERAKRLVGPLVGAYELRLGDAHMPSSDLGQALALCGIDPDHSWLRQAMQLIERVAASLAEIADVIAPTAGAEKPDR